MNSPALARARNHGRGGLISLAVALCLILTGFTMQSAQAADTGSITGKVFTKAVGQPQVAANSVFIYLSYSATINGGYDSVDSDPSTPATNGFSFTGNTFNLTGLKAGYYKFEVAGVGDEAYQREYYNNKDSLGGAAPVQVGAGATTVDDMVLEPAGQITGKITDRAGNPLANATISFEDSEHGGSANAKTDANGNFTSETDPAAGYGAGLVRGSYRVAARLDDYTNPDAPSYEQRYWQNGATYAAATPVAVTPGATTGSVNITLDVAPRMRLTVKDPAGNPLPNTAVGIYVFYDGAWGPYQAGPNDTDATGVYRRTLRIGDRYKFFVTPPAGVGGVKEWYDNAYTEATAKEIKATAYGQVIDFEIKLGPAPAATITAATPKITGTTTSGKTLTAAPGSWAPSGVSLGYQWLASGAAISKATARTFRLTNAQAGKKITVKVTGTLAGATAVTKISAATAATKGVLTPKKVSISGTKKVGKKLRADTAAWGPKPVKLTYKWYRNGKTISGQKSRTYKLRKADKGKRISVRVYQNKTSYLTANKVSAKTGKVK